MKDREREHAAENEGGGREGHCTHELPTATTTVTAQARVWHLHHGLVMYDFPLSHTEKPRLGCVGGRCICYWSRWKHLHLSQTLVGENKKKRSEPSKKFMIQVIQVCYIDHSFVRVYVSLMHEKNAAVKYI